MENYFFTAFWGKHKYKTWTYTLTQTGSGVNSCHFQLFNYSFSIPEIYIECCNKIEIVHIYKYLKIENCAAMLM